MLNDSEKQIASELLKGFELFDLAQLSKTVTGGNLPMPESKEDAISAIVSFEESLESLLGRKKVSKVVLFKFLYGQGINHHRDWDKGKMIKFILEQAAKGLKKREETSQEVVSSKEATSNILPHLELMCEQFVEWFYTKLNGSLDSSLSEKLEVNDFWSDARGCVRLVSSQMENTFVTEGADDLLSRLFTIQKSHNLYFNPNLLGNGVKGTCDPTGSVAITACGTLHRPPDSCLGSFEQMFIIIQDHRQANKWKIKGTELRLRVESANFALEEGERTSALM